MKLPKNTKDWHHELVIAATQRFNLAVQGNKRTQNMWRTALEQLQRSQNPVYIMKSGENRGRLRGLPKKLDGRVYDIFRDIVKGIEPVNIQAPVQRLNFREEKFYKGTKYRDGRYAFLASIYSQTADEHSFIYGNIIRAGMHQFTDLEVDGDRWGKRGAWKAKDTVLDRGLVSEDKTQGSHRFRLTQDGFAFCHALFTEKYHPSVSVNCVLVRPRAGFVPNNGPRVEDVGDRNVDAGGRVFQDPLGIGRPPANRGHGRKLPATILQDNNGSNPFGFAEWEDAGQDGGHFMGDDNNNYDDDDYDDHHTNHHGDEVATNPAVVIPSSRERELIARARIAMFEKSRPTPKGPPISSSAASATTMKTELQDLTDESKEKFLSLLSLEERGQLDDQLASLLRDGLSEDEAWAVSKDMAKEERRKRLKMQQEEDLQLALWKSQHDTITTTAITAAAVVVGGKMSAVSRDTFESSQEQMDFILTLSASEYDAINSHHDAVEYYDEHANETWEEGDVPPAIKAELLEPHQEEEEEFQADWKSGSDSDGSSTFALDLNDNNDFWLSSTDYGSSSVPRVVTVIGNPSETHSNRDQEVIVIDETSPTNKAVVNLIDDDVDSSPRTPTPLRRIDNNNNRRTDPPSTCRSVIRSLDDCVIDLTSDGPDSSGKKGPTAIHSLADTQQGCHTCQVEDSSSPTYSSPRKKHKYSVDTTSTTSIATATAATVVGSIQRVVGSASAGWSDWVGGSIRSTATLSLLVDLRERKDQAQYRSFFHSITQKCGDISTTPETRVSVVQQSLHLGDFLFAYEHENSGDKGDDILISHVLIERKSIKDIVGTSADRSGTGSASRYWKQERRMRFCSLRTPIMLIEGKIVDASIRKVRPLISKESDLEKPDVIACNSELESYMAAVICRNIGPHRIFIAQTFDSGHTAAYLAAMSLMMAVDAGNRVTERRPLLKEFSKYCSGWGGGKRGRDCKFLTDLQLMVSSTRHSEVKDDRAVVELSMRVARRFGDWNVLRSALDCCSTDMGKRLLLVDLQVGGSNHDAGRFISNYELSDSDESGDEIDVEPKLPIRPQLALCCKILTAVSPSIVSLDRIISTALPSTERKVLVSISQSVLTLFGEDYPSYVEVVPLCDPMMPTTIQVEQTLFGCRRRSEVISVAVLPGDRVVEWFIDSMAIIDDAGRPPGNPLIQLLRVARATANRCLDEAWPQLPSSSSRRSSAVIKEQRVIVLENLIQANLSNGSFGKLASRIPSPTDEDGENVVFFPPGKGKAKGSGSYNSSASSSSSSSSSSGGIGRGNNTSITGRALSVSAARSVSASATRLYNLLVCVLQVEFGVQVYNVSKAEDTASFLRALVREANRQALLISADY